jgi:two-component system NtrC family sensor kinase
VALSLQPPLVLPGQKILVVDDEVEMARLLGEMLARDGHRVELAGNGVQALEKLQQSGYDLILSDLRMPEMDGPTLYRELENRQSPLYRRIVFVTGDTLDPATRAFLEQTRVLTLNKPFTSEEVRQVVQRCWLAQGPTPHLNPPPQGGRK